MNIEKVCLKKKAGDSMAATRKKPASKAQSKQTEKTKAIDIEPTEVIEDKKLIENPLLQSQVISPDDELETKVALVNEIESTAILTKEVLAVKRRKVELEVDNKKLDVAKKTISNIEKIIDAVSQTDVLERVTANINKPQDMKYMAEAAEKLSNTLKGLMNPNVIDELGTQQHKKINFMFKSSGPVDFAMSIPDNREQ